MIDSEGFRYNVGIIICNSKGQLLWAKRIGQEAWQFPQGGINEGEEPEEALFRELNEEVGLDAGDVEIVSLTQDWLHYRLPTKLIRQNVEPKCIGQKQKWFLLKLLSTEDEIILNKSESPEFDDWRWVSYWYPLNQVIDFKKEVYRRALKELIKPMNKHLNPQN